MVSLASVQDSNNDYDFFEYVVRWPGSEQGSTSLPTYVDSFTLHGIWPTLNDSSYPSSCTDQAFDEKDIESILQPLREAWWDFSGADSTELWSHEWSKHGTCSLNLLPTQYDFFDKAIQLHASIDVYGALEKGGVVPGNDYSWQQIVDALHKTCEPDAIITCYELDGKQLLDVISYCVNKYTWEIFQCAEEFYEKNPSTCPDTGIVYPKIKYENEDIHLIASAH